MIECHICKIKFIGMYNKEDTCCKCIKNILKTN